MIGKFWDALFDYADDAREKGDETRLKICHEIQDLLQQAYDDGMSTSIVVKSRTPKTKVEKLALSIPDIKVYKDPNDGQIWYELECEDRCKDTMRYDYPEEVLKRVIDYRTNRLTSSMGAEREKVLIYLSKLIRDVRIVEDVMKDGGKKVVETRSRK